MSRLAGLVACSLLVALPAVTGESRAAQARRDLRTLDVCRAVPGEVVATSLGGALVEMRPSADKDGTFARCTYIVAASAGTGAARQGYVLYVYPPSDFESLKAFTEAKLTAVPDLGDGAYGFLDSGDGRYKLRVLRRGDVTLEATASTAAGARALAEAAFKALAKEP